MKNLPVRRCARWAISCKRLGWVFGIAIALANYGTAYNVSELVRRYIFMAHTQKALEKKETRDSIFVSAEHLFGDLAKNTQDITMKAFEIFNERGRMFGHELEDWFRAERSLLRKVPIEIKDIDGKLNIHAEVPGFTADMLKVSVEPNRLIIKGENDAKSEKKDHGTIYSEWKSNKIFRSFELPCRVDPDKATATIKDGVLTLVIPKVIDKKPNEVAIKPA